MVKFGFTAVFHGKQYYYGLIVVKFGFTVVLHGKQYYYSFYYSIILASLILVLYGRYDMVNIVLLWFNYCIVCLCLVLL